MTTAVTKTAPLTELQMSLETRKNTYKNLLPRHVPIERFVRSVVIAAARTPSLLNADRSSLFLAVQQACQLGLDCSGTLGSAYLIPYGGKVTLVIGYKGLLDLARRGGDLASINAQVVYSKDTFNVRMGTEGSIEHVPNFSGDRGQMVCAYAVVTLKNGEKMFEVMTKDEIESIRKRSKAGNSGPWVTDTGQMWRKTVIRRILNYVGMNPDLMTALTIENAHEADEAEALDSAQSVAGYAVMEEAAQAVAATEEPKQD